MDPTVTLTPKATSSNRQTNHRPPGKAGETTRMNSREWLEAYKAGQADERQFLFHPTYVQGHCFPQGHIPARTTSSRTPDTVDTCIRCGAKVIFSPGTEAHAPLVD